MTKEVLFVTWDGPQTAYLENLFLPIFNKLQVHGWKFHVAQFTWANEEQVESRKRAADDAHVGFTALLLPQTREIVPTALAVIKGAWILRELVSMREFSTVMFRSIVPAVIVRFALFRIKIGLIYDSDGLPIEEKIEQGAIREHSALHHFLRATEQWALNASRVILARSLWGAQTLIETAGFRDISEKVHIVSNGRVSTELEAKRVGAEIATGDHPQLKLCYLGSWGKGYRPQRMLELARQLRGEFPATTLEIFTGDIDKARSDLREGGVDSAPWIRVRRVEPDRVKHELGRCDVGFSFREVTLASQGTSPVKLGEYLESGVAIVGDLIGDSAEDLVVAGLMFVPDLHSDGELFRWVREGVIADRNLRKSRALEVAKKIFSIDMAAAQYHAALIAAESGTR